jgi:hypothetical protein
MTIDANAEDTAHFLVAAFTDLAAHAKCNGLVASEAFVGVLGITASLCLEHSLNQHWRRRIKNAGVCSERLN